MTYSAQNKPGPIETIVFKTVGHTTGYWWLLLAAGMLLITVGIWVINDPFQSYLALSWVFAWGMIGTGLVDILFGLLNRHTRRWIWWLLAGIADIVVGTFLFNNTLITILLLPVVIGLWTLYKGLMAIGDAFHIRSYKFGSWLRLLFTALAVVLMALFLLLCPVIGIENIFLISGCAFVAAGVFRVYMSFKLRSLKRTTKKFKTIT